MKNINPKFLLLSICMLSMGYSVAYVLQPSSPPPLTISSNSSQPAVESSSPVELLDGQIALQLQTSVASTKGEMKALASTTDKEMKFLASRVESLQRQLDELSMGLITGIANDSDGALNHSRMESISAPKAIESGGVTNSYAIEKFYNDENDSSSDLKSDSVNRAFDFEVLPHINVSDVECKANMCRVDYSGELSGPSMDGEMLMGEMLSREAGSSDYTIHYSQDDYGNKAVYLEFE
ncbi:MAG: hypothetical protein ABJN62_14550 [Halioglobus sp.]